MRWPITPVEAISTASAEMLRAGGTGFGTVDRINPALVASTGIGLPRIDQNSAGMGGLRGVDGSSLHRRPEHGWW
jgi:hypothetical protein